MPLSSFSVVPIQFCTNRRTGLTQTVLHVAFCMTVYFFMLYCIAIQQEAFDPAMVLSSPVKWLFLWEIWTILYSRMPVTPQYWSQLHPGLCLMRIKTHNHRHQTMNLHQCTDQNLPLEHNLGVLLTYISMTTLLKHSEAKRTEYIFWPKQNTFFI